MKYKFSMMSLMKKHGSCAQSISLGAALIMISVYANAQEYLCRPVDKEWIWFSDHLVSSVTYLVVGPMDRTYEIATGLSIGGRPLGWKSKHSGTHKVSAWGMGAVHIRRADNGSAFKVCVTLNNIDAIKIMDSEF